VDSASPTARSPIRQIPPTAIVEGWEVSSFRSSARLRLSDLTPYSKTLVHRETRELADRLPARLGDVRRTNSELIAAIGPTEWMIIGPPRRAGARFESIGEADKGSIDATYLYALVCLIGDDARRVLEKICAIDLSDSVMSDDSAVRSSIAQVHATIIRRDVAQDRSYLLLCDRSYGQYLFDCLMDAGSEFGISVDGYANVTNGAT